MIFLSLKNKLNYFRRHNFVRSVAFLQMASVIGNFVQALIGVFIARLLQPGNYGVYTIALSLASLIFISTGVQETITVILGKTHTENNRPATVDALAFFLRFTIVFSVLTLFITLFLPEIAKVFYHNSQIGIYAAVIIIASIFSSFAFSMSVMILQVSGNIRTMAILTVADQVVRLTLSLLLVFLGYGIFGAVLGHLIGAVIIFVIAILIWQSVVRQHPIFPSLRELIKRVRNVSAQHYLSFSIWVTIDKNISSLFNILPILFVGAILSHSEVTFFKLAFSYVGLALSLLGPISTLLNSELSKMQVTNPDNMRKNFIRISLYAIGVSTILTLGAVVTAPFVFRILYGPSFAPSIRFVPYLFIYGALYGIGVGLGPMWRAINKVKVSILINTIILGVGIPAGLVLIRLWGLWGAIVIVTAWYTISHLTSFIYLNRHLKSV